jgi:peroxiredoxin
MEEAHGRSAEFVVTQAAACRAARNPIAIEQRATAKGASTMPRFLKQLVAVLVVGLALNAYGQQDVHATLIAKSARKPAPVFHLVAADGKTVQVSDYRGQIVLLNFWATTCGGCILEIPSFIELQRTYQKSGFTAVGVSAEIPYDGLKTADQAWAKVRPFMATHKINYPVVMGTEAVVEAYGFDEYPASFLIDKSGRIAASYVGVVNKNDVEANIKALLAER